MPFFVEFVGSLLDEKKLSASFQVLSFCIPQIINNSLYVIIVDYCWYALYSFLFLEVQTLSRKSIYAQCHVWICICVLFVLYLYLSKSKCLSGLVLMLGAMFGVCLAVTFSWLQLWGSQARIIHSQAPGGQPEITDCKYEIQSQNTKTLQIQIQVPHWHQDRQQ